MDFVFRPYRRSDKKECSRIIAPTWRFDVYFPETKHPERMRALVVDMFRLKSDYTDVVVCAADTACGSLSGTLAGFLFAETAQTGILNKMCKSIVFTLFFANTFFLWLAGFFGNRAKSCEAFRSYLAVQKKMLENIPFDAEILCLFVNSCRQGTGLGSRLLERFYEWARVRALKHLVLITDTDCNYGFYERCGFKRLKESRGCLGIPQNGNSSSSIFVYGRSL